MTYAVANREKDATGGTSTLEDLGNAIPICGSLIHRPPVSATPPIFNPTITVPLGAQPQGTWVRVTGLFSEAETGTVNVDSTIRVKASGCYRLNVTGLVSQLDAISRTLIVGITVNDVAPTFPTASLSGLSGGFSTDTDRMFNISIDEIIELQKDDVVSLFFNGIRDSGTGTVDYEIHTFSFNISRVSGAYTEEDIVISPLDLNPTLWFDATDPANVTESGGLVTQWDDSSPNAFHMTVPGTLSSPSYVSAGINNLPSIGFDDTLDQGLFRDNVLGSDILSTDQATIFFVADLDAGSLTNQTPFQFFASPTQAYASAPTSSTTNNARFGYGGAGNFFNATSATLLGQPNIMTYKKDSSAVEIRQNGVQIGLGVEAGTLNTALTGPIRAGRSANPGVNSNLNGLLSEIIVYPYAMTIEEVQRVEAYLSSKYNIQ